ncbi:MAG: 2-amino-4-hydroxy-6-hydroxymethyldihydropteridine diphosphokinase [SAR324 cluster bacterium]|nr:2-amino-4-hydroxy-6-hydroxymethyldihydropteridine diphosphokinase [SAR324 cluster bacterium]
MPDFPSINVFIGLGSNLGDRRTHLEQAITLLSRSAIQIEQVSSIYESKPYMGMKQPDYYNLVVRASTTFSPELLLQQCLKVESQMGRVRTYKWAPRIVDIDILLYGNQIWNSDNLNIPHPDFQNRGFVMAPLNEISPDWIDPVTGQSLGQLWKQWAASHVDEIPILSSALLFSQELKHPSALPSNGLFFAEQTV